MKWTSVLKCLASFCLILSPSVYSTKNKAIPAFLYHGSNASLHTHTHEKKKKTKYESGGVLVIGDAKEMELKCQLSWEQ